MVIKSLLETCGYGYISVPESGAEWPVRQDSVSDNVYSVMNRCRLQIFYTGRVQGVGFRYTVKALASGFEVIGTVRNLADGRVELAAEGNREELSAFQQAIRESELGHFIQDENVKWEEPKGTFRGFEIVR